MKNIVDMENEKLKDIKQKAKVKWANQGDENSKFFHGMLNTKIRRTRLNGILIAGLVGIFTSIYQGSHL